MTSTIPDRAGVLARIGEPSTARHSIRLPRQLTSFVGRERELDEVIQALRAHRLVTICGPGGAGKTRLALAAAERLQQDISGGVFLAEMEDVTDSHLVASSVASALGVRERAEIEVVTSLSEAVGQAEVMILLENCGDQVAACADLAFALLQACPHVKLLASSREPLGVPGELAWRLPRLPIPPAEADLDLDVLGSFDSVRLFVERARSFQPSFTLSCANASAVARICMLTEGLPLAIELAAGRLTTLSVEQVADQLNDALTLLATSSRALPPRQRTLRATIDWSYVRLGPSEKVLFNRLSVFSGLASLDAVRAVCTDTVLREADVLDNLARLIDKSLVQAEAAARELRYRVLELPRQYASEQLEEAGEAETLRGRHAAYFAALADASAEEQALSQLDQWVQRVADDRQNFRTALMWSLRANPGLALRLAGGLSWFWHMLSNLAEGRRWLEQALATPEGDPAVRVRALRGAGQIVYRQGDFVAAHRFLVEALTILRQLADEPETALVLRALGLVLLSLADHRGAERCFEEALAIQQRLGRIDTGRTVGSLALVAIADGRYEDAGARLEACVAVARTTGDEWGLATAIGVQGELALEIGDYGAAQSHLQVSIGVLGRLNDGMSVAYRLEGFARLAAVRSEPERALTLAAAAAAIRSRLGGVAAPHWHRRLEESMAECRLALPARTTAAAEARGAALSMRDAIRFALEVADPAAGRQGPDQRPPTWASARTRSAGLSAREWDVLSLLMTGISNRAIASRLSISSNTVNKHVASILDKLQARSRSQAIAIVLGLELIHWQRQSGPSLPEVRNPVR